MKRFYKRVSTKKEPEGWVIHLDEKPLRTPAKAALLAPTEKLAEAIVKEWKSQEDEISPETMPLTQILSTQIDQVTYQRKQMTQAILKYLNTDLLCYRAGGEPPGQAEKQAEAWDPWLSWFKEKFGEELGITDGLAAIPQPAEAHQKVHDYIENLDNAHFTILQMLVPTSGSLVLGLAFIEHAIQPEEIYKAARVEEHFKDEIYNAEFYGRDPLIQKKDAVMQRDLKAAKEFLKRL